MTTLSENINAINQSLVSINQASYQVMGDQLALSAELQRANSDLMEFTKGQLELWASLPGSELMLNGIRIASLPVELPFNSDSFTVNATTSLLPPAGKKAFELSLMLLAESAQGMQVISQLPFSCPQTFIKPSIEGGVTCHYAAGSLSVTVAAVTNPRDADNLSGSLVLQLWTLDESYTGGAFSGLELGALELGVISGGSTLENLELSVSAEDCTNWQNVTLMLREWTADGYLTRDYLSLELPQTADAVPVAEAAEETTEEPMVEAAEETAEEPVVEAAEEVAEEPVVEAAEEVAEEPAVEVAEEVAEEPAVEAAEETAEEPVVEAAEEVAEEPAVEAAEEAAEEEADDGLLNVNTASQQEIARLKGINGKVAAAVVSGRPYDAIEQLMDVKGIGKKTYEKLAALVKV